MPVNLTTSFPVASSIRFPTVWKESTGVLTTLRWSASSAVEWGCTSARFALQAVAISAFKGWGAAGVGLVCGVWLGVLWGGVWGAVEGMRRCIRLRLFVCVLAAW